MDREPHRAGPARVDQRLGGLRVAWAIGAAGCAAAFVALAALVFSGAARPLDSFVHDRLRAYSSHNPRFLDAMSALTHLGDTAFVALGAAALIAVTLVRGRRSDAIFAFVAAVSAFVMSRVLRATLGRPRPADRLWEVTDAGFPSGHAANAAALAAIVVIVCWPLLGRAGRVVITVGAAAYATLVGLTRLAGAVHWLTDVLGGWFVAAACVFAVAALTRSGTDSGFPHKR